jgi:hypothetical protein
LIAAMAQPFSDRQEHYFGLFMGTAAIGATVVFIVVIVGLILGLL